MDNIVGLSEIDKSVIEYNSLVPEIIKKEIDLEVIQESLSKSKAEEDELKNVLNKFNLFQKIFKRGK